MADLDRPVWVRCISEDVDTCKAMCDGANLRYEGYYFVDIYHALDHAEGDTATPCKHCLKAFADKLQRVIEIVDNGENDE